MGTIIKCLFVFCKKLFVYLLCCKDMENNWETQENTKKSVSCGIFELKTRGTRTHITFI